jgi:hypothetical protein
MPSKKTISGRSTSRKKITVTVADRLRARIEREAKLNAKIAPTPLAGRLRPLKDAADQIGLKPDTLRRYCLDGKAAYHRIGGRILVSEIELARIAGVAVA